MMTEVLGLALPGSASPPAVDGAKQKFAYKTFLEILSKSPRLSFNFASWAIARRCRTALVEPPEATDVR